MKSFFKYVLATIVGLLLTCVLSSLICFFFFVGIISSLQTEPTTIDENTILKLTLTEEIPDKITNELSYFDFQNFRTKEVLGLNDILKDIDKAKNDDKIKGIYLELSNINAGLSTIEEIRNKLIDFKKSGKFIIAYSCGYSQGAYYLASVSDKIFLNPQGAVEWKGLNMQVMFYSGLLEKLGVEMQIFRHGQYKSAIEPFINKEMSEANKKQSITLIQSIWDDICTKVSSSRGISVEKLNTIADNLSALKAESAMDDKIVDGLKYYDEILDELQTLSGNKDDEEDMFVTLGKYHKSASFSKKINVSEKTSEDKIAVVFAEGEIVDGEESNNNIAGDDFAAIFRKVREDKDIKAVVLRVNSPGGSGLASEIIWREVKLTKDVKPVVVSMGNYAASGGYYISCPANYIYAQANTITGSIGVFGTMPNIKTLAEDKIGITVDGVKTNEHSDFGNIFRPVNDAERTFIQNNVEEFYETFISRVSEGRNIDKAQVDSIGQGRVWSGVNALEINLIDSIGGLNDALKKAVELAKIKDNNYSLKEYPEKKSIFEDFMTGLEMKVSENKIKKLIGDENYFNYKTIERMKNSIGIQSRLEYDIILK